MEKTKRKKPQISLNHGKCTQYTLNMQTKNPQKLHMADGREIINVRILAIISCLNMTEYTTKQQIGLCAIPEIKAYNFLKSNGFLKI